MAFDNILHGRMNWKVRSHGIKRVSQSGHNWLEGGRGWCVESCFSHSRTATNGAPQGLVLGRTIKNLDENVGSISTKFANETKTGCIVDSDTSWRS